MGRRLVRLTSSASASPTAMRAVVLADGASPSGQASATGPYKVLKTKKVGGEGGFDYANLFCNPDYTVASTPGRLPRQVSLVGDTVHLDAMRLRRWILAWAGLAAAFFMEDGLSPIDALQMAELAAAETALLG